MRALVRCLKAPQTIHTQESELARQTVGDGIAKHLQWLDENMTHVKRAIRDHIDNDPTQREKNRLLESVPGLGVSVPPHCSPSLPTPRALITPVRL